MSWFRTPARLLASTGLALALAGSAAQAQYATQQPRQPIQRVADATPVYTPAPSYGYDPGCATGGYVGGGCASGNCGAGGGSPGLFAPNKHMGCRPNGCQPYCATKIYPHSDWLYIKKYCGPTLIPGSCYGHFPTQWRKWEEVCPGWQPNNDADCSRGVCVDGGIYPGQTYQPGPGMPMEQHPMSTQPMVPMQPLPAPPAPMPNPAAPTIPQPMPPVPQPKPLEIPQVQSNYVSPSVTVPAAVAETVPAIRTIDSTPAGQRVASGRLLRNPLATPSLLPTPTDD